MSSKRSSPPLGSGAVVAESTGLSNLDASSAKGKKLKLSSEKYLFLSIPYIFILIFVVILSVCLDLKNI